MKRKGWFGQSYKHALAARGISTGISKNKYFEEKSKLANLFSDGRAEAPDFAAQARLNEVEKARARAFKTLEEAQENGKITFDQAEKFFEEDFKNEVKDFMDKKFTAEQFQGNVNMKLRRMEPVKFVGVSQ